MASVFRRQRRRGQSPPADDKARRSAFLSEAKKQSPYVAAQVGDEVFIVRTDDEGVGRAVFLNQGRQDLAGLESALSRLGEYGVRLPDEPVFVDVGANIGTTTVTALRRHGFASAVAIEPAPGNFRLLRLNLIVNGVEGQVSAIEAAVSDHEGEVQFDVSRPSCGSFRIAKPDAEGTVAVKAVTLDGLAAGGVIDPTRVGMLWVDAVGHEPSVLAGGLRLLEAGVPAVVAVRRKMRLDPETRGSVSELLAAHYTHVAELRRPDASYPIAELGTLLDGLDGVTDVLLVRR
ncbi:MAG TPA: FkbM family methyltransferase [Gaiellaceae bacterium]|nr:FkbM family methyltransferase [Gaiellaceae bacterium]